MERNIFISVTFEITGLATEKRPNGDTIITAVSQDDYEFILTTKIPSRKLSDEQVVRQALLSEYKNQLAIRGSDDVVRVGSVV